MLTFIIESVVLCVFFTAAILFQMGKPLKTILYGHPPQIVDRVIELGMVEDEDRKTPSRGNLPNYGVRYMRRLLATIFVMALALRLAGCSGDVATTEDKEAIQILADRSYLAKEYAAGIFADDMAAQGITDYIIEKTAYGFYTSETPESVYVVGFVYRVKDEQRIYGCKVRVDDNAICTVIEEGTDIAAFLFDAGEENVE